MSASTVLARACRTTWSGILWVDRLIRIHFVFFSGLLPLLGASTVRRDLNLAQTTTLLGVALSFHIYSYVFNDVIDLPVDRTQPLRRLDPLVTGTVRPAHALVFALLQPLVAMWLTTRLGGGARAQGTLAFAFACMAIYDLYGKRAPVPPLTDAVQGIAWGSLAVYAAEAVGGAPTVLTWTIAIYAAGFILFINGVHGGLRDLDNDLANGARTTAIYLGARPARGRPGEPIVPRAVSAFASVVLAGLIALVTAALVRNDFGYTRVVWMGTAAAVGSLAVVAVLLQPMVTRPRRPTWDTAFRLQIYVVLVALPVAFAAYVSAATLLVLVLLTSASLLPLDWTYVIARSAGLTIRSALPSTWEAK